MICLRFCHSRVSHVTGAQAGLLCSSQRWEHPLIVPPLLLVSGLVSLLSLDTTLQHFTGTDE